MADSFRDIPERLAACDSLAEREVYARFAYRLIALARSRLDKKVHVRVDAEDIVQSVYRSFFGRQQLGQFQLENWDGLWSLLALITVRKCNKQAETHHAARRDVNRENPPSQLTEDVEGCLDLQSQEPTPEHLVMLEETLVAVYKNLKAGERELVQMRLQGYMVEELATHADCTERTIYRLLERVRKILEDME